MKVKILLFVLVVILGSGCKEQGSIVPPSGEFTTTVKAILDRSCGGPDCHGGGPRGFAAALDLTSYDGIFRGSKNGAVVISGNPYMSPLVQTINQTDTTISPLSSARMPLSRDPLPNSDIQAIVQWIRDGARNDEGSLPFPDPRPMGKVFFTSQSVDLAGIIDISTGLIMRYVKVGNTLPFNTPPQSPHNVQIDDQGLYYYVTLVRGNKLRKYDAATNELLGEVSVGTSPAHVVITDDGSRAFVTNFDQSVGRIYAVNTSTMIVDSVISRSTFMKATHGARLSHDGRFLYIGNNGTDLITIIQTSDYSVLTHLPVVPDVPPFGSFSYKPYQIAVRGDDRFIYVTCNGRALVSVIERNGDTFSWRDTIPVGRNPLQCEVTRDERFLYVCNQGSGSVSVIDAQTNHFFTTIDSVGNRPHGVDISDDSHTVFVTLENTQGGDPPHHPIVGSTAPAFLAVIDVRINRVIRKIEIGGFGAGVSVFPGRGN